MSTSSTVSPTVVTGRLLRFALKLDTVVTAASAIAYLAAFAVLDGLLGLPADLLVGVGAFLLVYAGLVWTLAARPAMPVAAVVAVVAANVLWALDSFALLALGWFDPTLGGQVVIAVQATGVLLFAGLQALALRRP